MPYVELHAHSAFSFLDGATLPSELAGAAAQLGYEAFALTDHNGVYGSMEFAQAAKAVGVRAIHGAEVDVIDAPWQRPAHRSATADLRAYATDRSEQVSGGRVALGAELGYERVTAIETARLVAAAGREPGLGWSRRLDCLQPADQA